MSKTLEDEWFDQLTRDGFSGSVRVLTEAESRSREGPKRTAVTFARTVGDPGVAAKIVQGAPREQRTEVEQQKRLPPDVAPIPVVRRVPRWRSLAWLFNLISVEEKT